jgi:hypothetical protein
MMRIGMGFGVRHQSVAGSRAVVGVSGPNLPDIISKFATIGDSITEQDGGSSGLTVLYAAGYGNQTQARLGRTSADWQPDTAHNKLTFATGGKRTDEVYTLHLDDVCASDADLVIDAPILNDVIQSISSATIAANRLAAWQQIRASGKHCVPIACLPMQTAVSGNGAGAVSARVVAANAACAAAAAANDFPYVDVSTPLEATPGTGDGVGDAACFDGTLIHPNVLGCQRMGNALATYLLANFTFGIDPLDMGGTLITTNGNFAAGAARPTGFTAGAPTNGSIGTETKSTADGINWWRLPCVKGTSTSTWFATRNADDGTTEGYDCDGICLFRIISGTIDTLQFTFNSVSPSVIEGQFFSSNSGMALTSADGILYMRCRKKAIDPAKTQTWPTLIWRSTGDATVEIGYLAVRRYGLSA